jgi:hypothetical protein
MAAPGENQGRPFLKFGQSIEINFVIQSQAVIPAKAGIQLGNS